MAKSAKPVDQRKAETRLIAKKNRASVACAKSVAVINRHLTDVVGSLHKPVVSAYLAIADEIDLMPSMKIWAGNGQTVCLPVVTQKNEALGFRKWTPDTALQKGPLATRHPGIDAEQMDPDIILLPLLAFDGDGYRLGWGGGFYDRTLGRYRKQGWKITALGVAFAAQRWDALPVDDYDQAMDGVVTENGVTWFKTHSLTNGV